VDRNPPVALPVISVQLCGRDVIGQRCRQSSWRHDGCKVHYVIGDVSSDVCWWSLDWPACQLHHGRFRSLCA